MANTYAGGIYVVAATKDGETEYWAAATPRAKAAFAVKEMLPPGWACTVTDRHLTPRSSCRTQFTSKRRPKVKIIAMSNHRKRPRDSSQLAKLIVEAAASMVAR
jgi:hypothetical protein